MSRILNITRGSFVCKKLGLPVTSSVVSILGGSTRIPSGSGILVSGFSVDTVEKSSIIQCFNDVNHIYAFGHDPEQSTFSLSYSVFFGTECMRNGNFTEGDSLNTVVNQYNSLKVSEYKTHILVSLGKDITYKGIVLGMHVSVADPELNLLGVTIMGKIIDG